MSPQNSTASLLAAGEKELVAREDEPQNATLAFFERLSRDPDASVEKIERLMALWERGEARKAEADFNAAMSATQKGMKAVAPDAFNPQTRSRYASYEALDAVLRPIYTEHGFGLSFDTGDGAPAECVRVLCYATHSGGHARTYRIDMPADGKGAKGGDVMTKTHATASGVSYGMRYLLKMIFNVAVGEGDDDGNQASSSTTLPAAPKGFEDWWTDFQATADNGLAALESAWKASKADFKTYASKAKRDTLNALKKKAGSVAAS